MTTDDLAVATTSLAKDVDALADSVQLAVGELRRLRQLNRELVASLKEMRDALAAAMRAMVLHDSVVDAWVAECRQLGILDGLGVRADAAIEKAESR